METAFINFKYLLLGLIMRIRALRSNNLIRDYHSFKIKKLMRNISKREVKFFV